ncbi:hypothetical protein C6A37_03865 [Desulfobacteraceae bacterium SEEP-SAG9]|nr:hypothetical protein C6A37_03865 [Desulfobacteraceae bacterium SEEP-SAG9]
MMRFSLKTLFYFIAVMIILSVEVMGAEMTDQTVNLPKTLDIWTRSESAQIINSKNIFDYMNGGGELYLAYGFDHLEVYEYTADQQDTILVEVYYMNTSDDAFGLLSMDWGGEAVTFNSKVSLPLKPTVSPPVRALYGGGLLRIWADTIYARVMAFRETAESKEAVLSLGQMIAANRNMPAEPELLKILPKTMNSDWELRNDRIGYFRSYLVLNSLYYLGHKNILHLDHSTEAVTAPYENTSNAGIPKRIQVLFVKYATPERARMALNNFHNAYLPEHKKGFNPGLTHNHTNAFNIEDGWLGYSLDGPCLAIVFECPSRESVYKILKHISYTTQN